MYSIRSLGPLLVGLLALLLPGPARAWVETRLDSQLITLEVDGEGKALVSFELTLVVRGGPLERYTIEGVDSDAEPAPEGRVLKAQAPEAEGAALQVARLSDGRLELIFPDKKGLTRGTYLLSFRYRTDLLGRALLVQRGGNAELTWTGPAWTQGIDSAKVVVRLPKAERAPTVPAADLERERLGLEPRSSGVFVSNVVRGQRFDEVELVRLYVAEREEAVYRVIASPQAFSAFSSPPESLAQPVPNSQPSLPWPAALIAGLLASALAGSKVWCLARSRRLEQSFLLRAPWLVRLSAVALLAGAGVGASLDLRAPMLGSLGILIAGLLTASAPSRRPKQLRGPGAWKRLRASQLESPRLSLMNPFVLGTSRGLFCFLTLLALSVWASLGFAHGGFAQALTMIAALAFLLLLFASSRDQHQTELGRASIELSWYRERILRRKLPVQVLGRFPKGALSFDEVRLRIGTEPPLPGLLGLELGVVRGSADIAQPFVLLRVLEGSQAALRMPRGLFWVRGRTEEERVAVLTPRLPSRASMLALLVELFELLALPQAHPDKLAQKAAKSAGSGAKTSKGGAPPSPAKAA